jgi:DNA polymerase III delta subunit
MSLTILTADTAFLKSLEPLHQYIKDEVNVKHLIIDTEVEKLLSYKTSANHRVLGKKIKKLGKNYKDFIPLIIKMT